MNLPVFMAQLVRFGLSGAAINVGLYVIYLLLTMLGIAPVLAATAVFAMGIPISLFVHARFSFRKPVVSTGAALVFWMAYVTGYFVQIGTLYALYRGLGVPHQIAQLIAMGVVALMLFMIQKTMVFKA